MNKLKLLMLLAPVSLLSGCSFGASIDTLMAPPKLSIEQEHIYKALTDSVGSAISLKYPKSGNYLSAFIIEDIDGDGTKEAVVFYERNVHPIDENPLRINIFDKDGNDQWGSFAEQPAEGSEIEKVMVSRLGDNDRINLIIGSSSINRTERIVSVYTYSDGVLQMPDFSDAYSFFDVTDLDGDGQNEFILLNNSDTGSGTAASVIAYRLDDEGKYHEFRCDLSGSFIENDSRISYGSLKNGQTAMYVDTTAGTGLIQTEIVYMDKTGLKKVFATPETAAATKRPVGLNTFDIDSDGMLEIPVQEESPGYEELPDSEKLMLTNWLGLDRDNKTVRKYTSYYSTGDGFIFIFPEKWRNNVTVRRDTISNELTFNVMKDGKRGRELMRICYAEDAASREDRLSTGYMLLHTKGDASLLAYIPQSGDHADGLSLTSGDVAVGFRFKD